jgi:hypothetical protein
MLPMEHQHLANNSNGKINFGISPLVQLLTAILFSDIFEEMTLSRFVFILVANRVNFSFKIYLIVKC